MLWAKYDLSTHLFTGLRVSFPYFDDMKFNRIIIPVILILLVVSCSDLGDPEVLEPILHVDVDSLAFGEVTVDTDQSRSLSIINLGEGDLEVTASLQDPGSSFSVTPAGLQTITAGDTLDLTITFSPETAIAHDATIRLSSNDPTTPELSVQLSGMGTLAPVPGINVAPASLDFGTVAVGADSSQSFVINSIGTADLSVTAITLTGDQYSLIKEDQPSVITPGSSLSVTVVYTPDTDGQATGMVEIVSDGSQTPPVVSLSGEGQTLVSYASEVQPIFDANCAGCHGSNGGLNLSSYSSLMAGTSNNGPVVTPGDGANSYLVRKLKGDGVGVMPPSGSLSSATIQTIEDWIDQGAQNN